MAHRNSQPHFTKGIGVYTPWRMADAHVKTAPKQKFDYKIGFLKDGKLVQRAPVLPNNRMIRIGRSLRPLKLVYHTDKKGWLPIPF